MANHPPKRRRRKQKSQRRTVTALVLGGAALVMALLLLLPRSPAQPEETRPTLTPSAYGPEDFVMENGYLRCTAPGARLGIDVSAHQGAIDWPLVAESGMEFAFIRIGYRGYSQGGLFTDEYAVENLRAAREAGLDVGVYFYSQAVSIEEAAEEALFCIRFLEGQELPLPVVFDWEYVSSDARTGAMDPQTLTDCARVFCETVEKAGFEAMVYFNPSTGRDLMDLTELQDYPFWLAMYTTEMDYPHAVEFWQYSETGTVTGIEGNVDLNIQLPQ